MGPPGFSSSALLPTPNMVILLQQVLKKYLWSRKTPLRKVASLFAEPKPGGGLALQKVSQRLGDFHTVGRALLPNQGSSQAAP